MKEAVEEGRWWKKGGEGGIRRGIILNFGREQSGEIVYGRTEEGK